MSNSWTALGLGWAHSIRCRASENLPVIVLMRVLIEVWGAVAVVGARSPGVVWPTSKRMHSMTCQFAEVVGGMCQQDLVILHGQSSLLGLVD